MTAPRDDDSYPTDDSRGGGLITVESVEILAYTHGDSDA
jgi:hypothetical protein